MEVIQKMTYGKLGLCRKTTSYKK